MSERHRWVIATLVASAMPAIVTAQDTTALRQRLHRLELLRHTAVVAVARAESARRERLDTVRSGALVILVRPGEAWLVRQASAVAWARLDSLYGDEAATLSSTPMLFFLLGRPRPQVAHLYPVIADSAATPPDVAFQLVRAGSAVIRAEADTVLSNWTGPLLLAEVPAATENARAYVELVTAPSEAVRRCYAGTADACAAALGLLAGDPALQWYDVAERRALVADATDFRLGRLRSAADACTLAGSDSACLEVLHANGIQPPLSTDARQSLVRLTLASGGRGALGRLAHGTSRSLSLRFALAAGMPVDSLILAWRRTIIEAKPKPVTIATARAWTALGWIVLMGLMAFRSSRWRCRLADGSLLPAFAVWPWPWRTFRHNPAGGPLSSVQRSLSRPRASTC